MKVRVGGGVLVGTAWVAAAVRVGGTAVAAGLAGVAIVERVAVASAVGLEPGVADAGESLGVGERLRRTDRVAVGVVAGSAPLIKLL